MILAITTGLSNARSEGYNRIVKHVGRIAFGFRNPDSNADEYGGPAPAITTGAIQDQATQALLSG